MQLLAADGTLDREEDWHCPEFAFGRYGLDDFGNDITRPLDQYCVADMQIFSFDLVLVMQGSPFDDHPIYLHGFQDGDRGNHAGSPNLKIDCFNNGCCLYGREFPGNCPPGGPSGAAQSHLQVQVVYFDDHAVDVIIKIMPQGQNMLILLSDLV